MGFISAFKGLIVVDDDDDNNDDEDDYDDDDNKVAAFPYKAGVNIILITEKY